MAAAGTPFPYPPEQDPCGDACSPMKGGGGWRSPPLSPSNRATTRTSAGWRGSILASSIPWAVVTQNAGLLVSGRAIRAENYLHLQDQQARHSKAARRAPKPGQRGRARWRRHRARLRSREEARHRCRVHHAHHEATAVVDFAHQGGSDLVFGDLKESPGRTRVRRISGCGRAPHPACSGRNRTRPSWRGSSCAGEQRGTSSTCPACQQRVPKPTGRHFCCPHCRFQGHRDLVGAANIAAK